jgi:predicted DNA-binding transcriptional regulator YafY
MNRFDRITALLVQLQAKRMVKGLELAQRFGVSLRTIYRDLRTLEEAGVPICGEPGVGYSLAEGYRLPPVMFTREEAAALFTADKLVAQLTDAQTALHSRTALEKLRAVLRRPDRDYLEAINPHITVFRPWGQESPPVADVQQVLLTAITERRVVRLKYRAHYNDAETSRSVEPIGLYYSQQWHLVAYCRLRQDLRDFRLDRIQAATLSTEHFPPRPDTLDSYWKQKAAERQFVRCVVCFGPDAAAQRLRYKHYFGWTREEATPAGLEMTFWVGNTAELVSWLLPFGRHATVLEPAPVREHLRALATELYAHHC